MKKVVFIFLMLIMGASYSFAQYDATVRVPDIDITGLNAGDTFIIPFIMDSKTAGGLITGFQTYIDFDHTIMSWNGTFADPTPGVSYFNPLMPYNGNGNDWTINDNTGENAMFAFWMDPNFMGVDVPDGDTFIAFIFTYNGGLDDNEQISILWNTQYTSITDAQSSPFNLSFVNGIVYRLYSPQVVELNLKVFLEGPYSNNQMTHTLNDLGFIPLSQPYNINPWNYYGSESVTSIPNPNVVDWVFVDLLKLYSDSIHQYFKVINRKAGFLLDDGTITDIDGSGFLITSVTNAPEFYVRVHHRNHLPTTSSSPLTESKGIYNYDFTKDSLRTIDGNLTQKKIDTDIWVMIAADDPPSQTNRPAKDVWPPAERIEQQIARPGAGFQIGLGDGLGKGIKAGEQGRLFLGFAGDKVKYFFHGASSTSRWKMSHNYSIPHPAAFR